MLQRLLWIKIIRAELEETNLSILKLQNVQLQVNVVQVNVSLSKTIQHFERCSSSFISIFTLLTKLFN